MGKGDKRRPQTIPFKEFDDKWDKIFNNKKTKGDFNNLTTNWLKRLNKVGTITLKYLRRIF